MNRIQVTMRCDARLQWRNGFYVASAVVVVLFAGAISWLPSEAVRWLLPAIVINNLIVNAFYFLAALVLLEKGEGSLQAQVVTPLRPGEYLFSKIATLSLLSLGETLLLVLLVAGLPAQPPLLLAGIILGAAFFALAGFIAVARYEAINQFLLPSMLFVSLLALPLVPYFGFLSGGLVGSLVYLHPAQAILLLLQRGLSPGPEWQVWYGILYSTLWIIILFRMALRSFYRFVVLGPVKAR